MCRLQHFSPDSAAKRVKHAEGVEHMKFVVELYRMQVKAGRTFLHEQPAYATSWALPEIKQMMRGKAWTCGRQTNICTV